tara:strand:+ start:833 stop:1225 length:393 start_codon:yes stop_codon:yes gene_type:complete
MKNNFEGFALIEVIIVIVLVSGSFLVFLEALNQAKSIQVRSEIVSTQSMLLHRKISQTRASGFDNVLGYLDYTSFPEYPAYKYSIDAVFVNENLETVNNAETNYKKIEISLKHNEEKYVPMSDTFLMTKK